MHIIEGLIALFLLIKCVIIINIDLFSANIKLELKLGKYTYTYNNNIWYPNICYISKL